MGMRIYNPNIKPKNLTPFGEIERHELKVRCHICGQWFKHLGSHVWQTHNISCDEYREEFELLRGQSLCSQYLSDFLSQKIINQGINGKYGDLQKMKEARNPSQKHRLQSRIINARAHTGREYPSSERRKLAAKHNYLKACIYQNCVICGQKVLIHKSHLHFTAICGDCRPEYKRKQNKLWRENHRDYLRSYWRGYRKKRYGELTKIEKSERRVENCGHQPKQNDTIMVIARP